ncbi:hypothetical protein MANES_06G104901v8 [Manihot esculenta]|uniref:Uncharacterized protein n=1 Tax=Manihot esculenta TaxID=3983 RepID=A0ACB7HL77_MANES|nr:hypothetical protein MANES_06G104901v8 [Manihot esculenta]
MYVLITLTSAFQEKRIPRQELIRRVRQLVGDKLLVSLITSYQAKEVEGSSRAKQATPQVGGGNHVNHNETGDNMDDSVLHG